ncbi:MAG TPA: hypothetical protein VMY88_06485, partial [Acidimicrobiales bacterium]|nr:hypothetical protein [Acidimicrobiales bacterium]
MGKRILVITGGEHSTGSADMARNTPFDFVIAADSGLDLAEAIGIRPDIVVGDLDSASPAAIARARNHGSEIEAHPAGKDQTDFEL